jgi:hypothetical protein
MRADRELTGMLNDDEFRTRLKLLAGSNSIVMKWRTINDELITATFPFLKTRERKVLGCIIQTIWDLGFTVAIYDEVFIRLKHSNKKLFPSKKIIDKSISDLCESRILNSEMSEFKTFNMDGTPSQKMVRVLELPREFRDEALNGMAEVFKMTMASYFSPRRKQ